MCACRRSFLLCAKGREILFDLIYEFNNELRSSPTFKQPASILHQITAVDVPSSGLPSDRLTLEIDTLEREYNSRPPQILRKLQQHPVSIQTTSSPTQRISQFYFFSQVFFDFSFYSHKHDFVSDFALPSELTNSGPFYSQS